MDKLIESTVWVPPEADIRRYPLSSNGLRVLTKRVLKRKEKPQGAYSRICEAICGEKANTCKLNPNQCPRAVNGSVDAG